MRARLIVLGCLFAVGCRLVEEGPGTYYQPADGNVRSAATCVTNAVATRTVAFLGGSITEMNGFRPLVMKKLRAKYPDVAFTEIAAGLSSTCSDTGAFRVERDVLSAGVPDLFIVEAAVNDDQDGHFDLTHCIRGLEGSVRHVLTVNPACRVVVGTMVNRHQYEQLKAGETPVPYRAAQQVAAHYGAVLADVGTALVASERSGGIGWEKYRDCHPSPEGCDFGADVVMASVGKTFDPYAKPVARALPAPLDAFSYFNGTEIDLRSVKSDGGWTVAKPDWESIPGDKRPYFVRGEVLSNVRTAAEATVPFRGTALAALVTAGPDSGDLEVSVDGGAFRRVSLLARYGQLHYPHTAMLADDLPDGPHQVRFRAVPAKREKGEGTVVRIHRLGANGGVR